MEKPKVAIVHDFITQYGGGEKVVATLSEIWPDAPIYTSMYQPTKIDNLFKDKEIITMGDTANKIIKTFPILSKWFVFLIPLAFENFDLSSYDIVISSSVLYSKGVITTPEQLHISYVHTPPRFLYGYSVESTKRNFFIYRPVVKLVDHYFKIWDFIAAQRPDYLLTISKNVRERIHKFYKRDADVIYPPVDTNIQTNTKQDNLKQPYYLALNRLVAYKNFDLVIEAFNILDLPLKIVGTGIEEKRLKALAKSTNIEFLGRVTEERKHELMEHAMGIIQPVEEEDFGIVPIEALAHGTPVFAHRSGGSKETIRDGIDGMFFDFLDLEHFVERFREFDEAVRTHEYKKEEMKKYANKFSKARFKKEFKDYVMQKWGEKQKEDA